MIGSSTHSIDQRKLAWLTLKLLPGLGNRSLLKLVSHFGSPEAVLQANAAEIHAVEGLRPHAVKALLSRRTSRDPSVEWQMLQSKGFRLVCLADPDYPANLAAIPDPPAVLFADGSLEPRDLVAIAVVGSRAASLTGMTFTERLSTDLAQCGVTVVSGFAMGIDSAAHRGALRVRGRTLAVLGCGLDQDYPQGNREMRIQIRNSGALLTEFLLGSPPEAGHFPARNRIISGLALGVVVVEAAQRSGSLITARLALEQGREVFAVPGMARHYRSAGVHQLLRQGAKLVETAQDVLDEIRPMIRRNPAATVRDTIVSATSGGCAHQGNFSEEEAVLMASLRKEPIHIDELGHRLQWGPSRVASVLVSLELKGAVQQLPGKHFVRMLDGC
ncbi:MAG TPA: DNA-protecting protein DprA [Syntrophobacteraceae bacterium]|nr:DNA-protecting protein DprA [Syntrophobacteraceae bacterium]HBZ55299.1 DNA-protecting protein DprA [Syntrophobacteraceae bacterium]